MGLLDNTSRADYYGRENQGGYQWTNLVDIINYFIVAYVGEDKIISKVKRVDVAFHAQRALAELNFDTLRSRKSHEIVVSPSLQTPLPIDYVNYVKLSWVDSSGIKHTLHPDNKTLDTLKFPYTNENGQYKFNPVATLTQGSNIIVLDGDYSAMFFHGLKVTGYGIKPNAFIHGISTVGGITSLTLSDKNNNSTTTNKNALHTTSSQITITGWLRYGEPMEAQGSTLVETTATDTTPLTSSSSGTQLSVLSSAGIEIGMYINHAAFVNTASGTDTAFKVVGVGDGTVEISGPVNHTSITVEVGDTLSFIKKQVDSTTIKNYKSGAVNENNTDDYKDDTYWPMDGSRYGLDPQRAQANGSFHISANGRIHFSSNVSGRLVVLEYISDGLATNAEMFLHKFAEEAMYKSIAHAILSTRANVPEYQVARFKKEKFAAIRTAKLRMSNLKLEELTQVLRGKSKQIKH